VAGRAVEIPGCCPEAKGEEVNDKDQGEVEIPAVGCFGTEWCSRRSDRSPLDNSSARPPRARPCRLNGFEPVILSSRVGGTERFLGSTVRINSAQVSTLTEGKFVFKKSMPSLVTAVLLTFSFQSFFRLQR
jgi:hypothetical protein